MKYLVNMKEVQQNCKQWLISVLAIAIFIVSFGTRTMAQQTKQLSRIAKIEVDPAQLEKYNAALKEQMTTAIRVEPGVVSYYAVADKKDPSHITIFEIYADSAAYKAHVAAPHFKKYKETVQYMVKSLEITDVDVIGSAKKPGM
ncbi:MAG TPA: putative quinol monooxygenase [Mucilaginibacter sp.]|nr:putative quinol monooxygenase [Mucilaginibacter sp.]